MYIFESLNCILCREPFARAANQPRSPRTLGCGLAMCNTCFENETLRNGKHQCNLHANCFRNSNFAYSLIDVLSQEDVLTLTPENRGYMLSKPIKIPECVICHDEYSNTAEGKKASQLNCGHIICTQCYLKMPRERNMIICPFCSSNSYPNQSIYGYNGSTVNPNEERNRFNDFLDELPKMTRQMEETRSCDQCHIREVIDRMHYCGECKSKICGDCGFRRHQGHKSELLLNIQSYKMYKEFRKDFANLIETYEKTFDGLDDQLFEDIDLFKEKMLSHARAYKNATVYSNLRRKHEFFTKLKTDFEGSAEKLLPHLRKFDSEVKEFIQALDEKFDQNFDEA